MALNSVLFAVRADTALRPEIDTRLARLMSVYAPLEPALVELRDIGPLNLLVGRIGFAPVVGDTAPLSVEDDGGLLMAWGGPVPRSCRSPGAVLDADATALRELDRTVLLIAASERRAVIANPASGPAALFHAAEGGVQAWASHALAAGVLARGRAAVAWDALPELLATGAVGGTETLVERVEAAPTASRVVITPDAMRQETYWPVAERWELLPEDEAPSAATEALLASLAARLDGVEMPHCALTAGLDSRAIAVALAQLGPFTGFTVGEPHWPDVRGAEEVCRALGARHVTHTATPVREQETGRRIMEAAALWADGQDQVYGLARPAVPPDAIEAIVTGNGGEIGRARSYRWAARNYREPGRRQLLAVLRDQQRRLAGADRGAREELDRRLALRLDDAALSGVRGWRLLDVLHAEHRTRRYVRARLARVDSHVITGFSSPELNRALVSLPLEARLADGFHTAFLARFAPQLPVPPEPPRQRRGVPRPLRRLAHRVRGRRAPQMGRWFLAGAWTEAPELERWIADAVLGHPRVADVMGSGWTDATREGFHAGDGLASQLALQLAGVVLVDEALSG